MKRLQLTLALAIIGLFVTTGCMGVASPVAGMIITDGVKWDGHASGKLGEKEGRACAQSYLSVYATGDASIKAAAEAGGIKNVMSVDHESRWLVVFGEYCTIVRGS